MKTVHDIALGLAEEIKSKYGVEAHVLPGMIYDLTDKEENKRVGEVVNDFINSYTIETRKYTISVEAHSMKLSTCGDDAKGWVGAVAGLPGVIIDTQVSKNSITHRFELADPTSVDKLMEEVDKLEKGSVAKR